MGDRHRIGPNGFLFRRSNCRVYPENPQKGAVMPDVSKTWPTTRTDVHIRPHVWTDWDTGQNVIEFNMALSVDCVLCGRGTGRTVGEAFVAAGLDMMGIEADLLRLTLDLIAGRERAKGNAAKDN